MILGLALYGLMKIVELPSDDRDNKIVQTLVNREDFSKIEEMEYGNTRVEISSHTLYKLKVYESDGNMRSVMLKEPKYEMSIDDLLMYRRVRGLYRYDNHLRDICKRTIRDSKILRKMIRR